MISDFFQNWIKKQKYGIVVYPNALFDLRIQEEMIRADEYKSYFVYVELDFAAIGKTLTPAEELEFWKAVLRSLATKGRGSDVFGLLENGNGLGIVLLDAKMDGWLRLEGRIREFAKDTVADIAKPLQTIKAFVYPAYIDESDKRVQALQKTTA